MIQVTQYEIDVLRKLAHEYMEIATLPIQRQKLELWKSFNCCDQTRPMVLMELPPLHELNYDGSLTCVCQDPFLKGIEEKLRVGLFRWKHFPADGILEPLLHIPFSVSTTQYYGLGVDENIPESYEDRNAVSVTYNNLLEEEEDIEKIQDIQVTLDKETSREWKETADYIFDGILPVHQAGGSAIPLQVWDQLSMIMGVENCYMELIDRPEFLHKILERVSRSVLNGIEQANVQGLYNPSDPIMHCSYTYTDELLPDFGAGTGADSYHSWSCCMAQLFSSVAPAVTEEFEVPYISKFAEKFGMMYYGCCERLDDRLDIVQKIPNVRKISCSPWSDKENFASKLNKGIIMSNKPTPTYLACPVMDADVVEKDLRETCEIAKKNGVSVEFILKDLSTILHQPQRMEEWAKIAMRVVEDY